MSVLIAPLAAVWPSLKMAPAVLSYLAAQCTQSLAGQPAHPPVPLFSASSLESDEPSVILLAGLWTANV